MLCCLGRSCTVSPAWLVTASLLLLIGGCRDSTGPADDGPPDPEHRLAGDATEAAAAAIPRRPFETRAEDYATDHPELPGMEISFNTVVLVFTLETTVGEANAVLDELDAEIVGGLPGRAGEVPGILMLRLPATSHAELIPILEGLREHPLVRHVVQDVRLSETIVTAPSEDVVWSAACNGSDASGAWSWSLQPAGGNWGLELVRAPQMWNLKPGLLQGGPVSGTATGVLDSGFAPSHPDLVYEENLTPDRIRDHGTHVAGIIGATFDNGVGIDGINPFARLVVSASGDESTWSLFDLLEARPDLQVVNISLGYNWWEPGINPHLSPTAQGTVAEAGAIARIGLETLGEAAPLLVVSAGNDSHHLSDLMVDARWGSPFTYAALALDVERIIVVESLERQPLEATGAGGSFFSNINGTISAPGSDILSTFRSSPYETCSGTSMAAPHVTGLAGFLLALDPTLSPAELRHLLLEHSAPAAPPMQPRIDAFAAALGIDVLRGTDRVLRLLLDIDDGTPDGNRRVDLATCDVIGGFADPGSCADYTQDQQGDGRIDMRDFRRWRDWLLQVEDADDLMLDGSFEHVKRDLNGDGIVDWPELENVFPRGDFNGNGIISRSATAVVPGFAEPVTDLHVFRRLFDDPHYTAEQLDDLIDSGDLSILPAACMDLDAVAEVRSAVRVTATADNRGERIHTPDQPEHVYTIAVVDGPVTATVEPLDDDGQPLLLLEEEVTVGLGGDAYWQPTCAVMELDVVFPEQVEPGEPQHLDVLAGVQVPGEDVVHGPGVEIEVIAVGGSVEPGGGATDTDGRFTATATLSSGNDLLTLIITATDPETGASATRIVEAGRRLMWTFDNDLDGWSAMEFGTPGSPPFWGWVRWRSWGGAIVELDGQGPGVNAALYKTIQIPAGATTLEFRTSPHTRAGSEGDLRVRVQAAATSTVLLDWERLANPGTGLAWVWRSADISAFAGQVVTIYFEHRDPTGTWGFHTQRYLDDISIR